MARATTTRPTMLMTKKAGPSPESAKAYSRPQTSHRGFRGRKPSNGRPRPQRGQRPRSPVEIGGGGDRSYSTASLLCRTFTSPRVRERPKRRQPSGGGGGPERVSSGAAPSPPLR